MTTTKIDAVVLLMTPRRAESFGEKVAALQEAYGTDSVVDIVERALEEACGR